MIEAFVWSTDKVRRSVLVDPFAHVPVNERRGCDDERIVDFGPHVGLITSTHWGATPFGAALQASKADG